MARDRRHIADKRNPDMGRSHATFALQRISCWTTRLQGPQPAKAAAIAAVEDTNAEPTSPQAKSQKRPSREMRALAIDTAPHSGSTSARAQTINGNRGSERISLMGQEKTLTR